jgi:hypothetical protein
MGGQTGGSLGADVSSSSVHLRNLLTHQLDCRTVRQAVHHPYYNTKNHEHMEPLLTFRTDLNFPWSFVSLISD